MSSDGSRVSAAPAAEKRWELGAWDLSALLPGADEAVVAEQLAELEAGVAELEALRPELSSGLDAERWREILHRYEALLEKMTVVSAYGLLWFSADTQSQDALTFRNRADRALTALYNRVLFLTLWWKELCDDDANRLLPDPAQEPDLRFFLEDLRRLAPFTLEERSEQIINAKDTNGIRAVLTLYSMLTNRLQFRFEEKGSERVLTRDEIMSRVFSPRASVRKAVYDELFRVFEGEATVLGQIYVNRVQDWYSEQVELRGHASPIAARNVANDLSENAVDTLLAVCAESTEVFQRYFRLKAGWLGIDRLRRYDIYAPLTASEREIPWTEAVDLVLETLGSFHPLVAEHAARVFTERRIDGEARPGKKSGAFCATVLPGQTPWLLMNYTGRVRDVATLAHELGHAVHSMLAGEHSILTQQPSLPLAETASVFAEMLLTDRLLAREDDPLVRRELLAAAMDDIYATVMRQAYFTRFEIEAHKAVLEGRSPRRLDALYFATLIEQFGEVVEVPEEFRFEWITIPHLYQTPFYCYAYSFGQLLVLSLYQRYRELGEEFVPGYLRLLSYGGSARPQRILSEVGVDVADADFWRGGFAVVTRIVDELESLST